MAKQRIFGAVNSGCRARLKELLDFFDLETIHYEDGGSSETFIMAKKDGSRIKLHAQRDGVSGVWLNSSIMKPITTSS